METVKVELECPKDLKEMIDLVAALTEHFVEKKPMTSLIELTDEVKAAVDGWSNISAEMKSQYLDEAVGYLVHRLMSAFQAK